MSTPSASSSRSETRSQLIARRLGMAKSWLKIDQATMGRALSLSQSQVSAMLGGKTEFTVGRLDEIERTLGIRADFLWSGQLPMLSEGVDETNKKSGGPLGTAATHESFLSESNRRPFHYRRHGNVIDFPARQTTTTELGSNATVYQFPMAPELAGVMS